MLSIRRRELLISGITLIPALAWGQTAKQPLVGALLIAAAPDTSYTWTHIVEDLRKLGYVEEQTVRFAVRALEGPVHLAAPAAEIVNLIPQVIYANGDEVARAVARATTSIPIVAMTDDHIGAGLTNSFARPSRNITGISRLEAELDTKRLELLHELLPSVDVVLVLRDPATSWISRSSLLEQAAARLGVKLFIRDIGSANDVDGAVAGGNAAGAQAILVLGSPLLSTLTIDTQIRQVAMLYGLPTVVQLRNSVRTGSLASYTLDQDAVIERIAAMIDRILKGTPLEQIPIEQPTKFELFINLKIAKSLGLTIPQLVLARADEVIE